MNKINVVGTSAVGKTTFAKKLAEKLQLHYIELDDLFWLDDWEETSDHAFFLKIQQAIESAKHGFVIDGNYTRTTHVKWQTIDTVIWLDFPFHINLYQSIKRAISRAVFNKKLWQHSNNRESFGKMFSADSIIWWMIKTHQKNRQQYITMMNDPQYSHIQFIHLKSRKDCDQFLRSF
ncbi:adenylate kinase [Acinetobacter bereziniae]|uniref:adenylate kinase n=1 Tax=Acinetobacter bereziniae TaxID=106648 RepID=UPI0012505D61|nr:adenylate kinase [Acinetobacter bereziniae]MCU4313612.1 adenylate kinase [Acinetobacter bereziniae]